MARFGVDEHPFATHFDVHQGYRVLTSHVRFLNGSGKSGLRPSGLLILWYPAAGVPDRTPRGKEVPQAPLRFASAFAWERSHTSPELFSRILRCFAPVTSSARSLDTGLTFIRPYGIARVHCSIVVCRFVAAPTYPKSRFHSHTPFWPESCN